MGTGPNGRAVDDIVRSLTAKGTNVYVGTDAVDIAGIAQADHVARWNGTSWSAVGANTAGTDGWFPATTFINALTTYGSLVVAAGSFLNANGTATADHIGYFDGTKWRPIGSDGAGNGPLPGVETALAVVNGNLYAAGNFTSAGGDGLARFLAAHSLRLPDSMIGGTRTGHFAGNGVYSSTGAGEVRTLTIKRGKSEICYLKIQNDGLVAATFAIKATGGANGIKARYFQGTNNVTPGVDAGTYSTGSIARRQLRPASGEGERRPLERELDNVRRRCEVDDRHTARCGARGRQGALVVVLVAGQPGSQPLDRRLELGIEVDEGLQATGQPFQADVLLAAPSDEFLDPAIGEVHRASPATRRQTRRSRVAVPRARLASRPRATPTLAG